MILGTEDLSFEILAICFAQMISSRRRSLMAKKQIDTNTARNISAQPRLHQRAREIQPYGTVSHMLPLELEEPVRLEMTEQLNQMLADTMTLRDLYKKSHWQVAGPTFYQLHCFSTSTLT